MSLPTLIRSAGIVSIFAGALIAIAGILHPVGETVAAALMSRWWPSHMLWWLGVVLLQLGLVGLYARHSTELGWLGLTGFVLAALA